MLKYIAAVATAVTLIIGSAPVASAATRPAHEKVVTQSEGARPVASVRIAMEALRGASAGDAPAPYLLSTNEQRALGRALFRSVKFIDSVT